MSKRNTMLQQIANLNLIIDNYDNGNITDSYRAIKKLSKIKPAAKLKNMSNSNPQRDLNNILSRLRADNNPQDREIINTYRHMGAKYGLYNQSGTLTPAPDPEEIEREAAHQVEPEELKGWINFEC